MPEVPTGTIAATVQHGDIGNTNGVGLTVLPASGQLKLLEDESIRTQKDAGWFGIVTSPKELESETFPIMAKGYVSRLLHPAMRAEKSKYVAFATTSLKGSDHETLRKIGSALGALSSENSDIRLIELPFLGAGRGGISPKKAAVAVTSGFVGTRHPNAILQFRNDNSELVEAVGRAIGDFISGATGRLFISYRRSDAATAAMLLSEKLRVEFNDESVFLDASMDTGVGFPDRLRTEVKQSDVVLAVIGRTWLDTREPRQIFGSRRRLSNPSDWVRTELEAALDHGAEVIPVLLDGTPIPSPRHLPGRLKRLATLNAIEMRIGQFPSDFERLSKQVRKAFQRRHASRR